MLGNQYFVLGKRYKKIIIQKNLLDIWFTFKKVSGEETVLHLNITIVSYLSASVATQFVRHELFTYKLGQLQNI